MARDEFPSNVRDVLAKRVGVRCSNPSCKKLTTGPRSDMAKIVNIGVAAHITAASPGGPRYNPRLSPEERQSAENGIWLCQDCAKLVDNDKVRYTVELLIKWKQCAEAGALAEIEGRPLRESPETSAEIELSKRKIEDGSERHDYSLEVTLINRGVVQLGPYHIDLEMPACVVHEPQNQPLYVQDRSTKYVALFRVDSAVHHKGVIYPGDQRVIMTIHYFIDNDIFESPGNLFTAPVRATLYHCGYRPVTIEKPFEDFQDF